LTDRDAIEVASLTLPLSLTQDDTPFSTNTSLTGLFTPPALYLQATHLEHDVLAKTFVILVAIFPEIPHPSNKFFTQRRGVSSSPLDFT